MPNFVRLKLRAKSYGAISNWLQLGFEVPRSNELSPDFHKQLLASLSLRAVGATEEVQGQETRVLYADRYGGDGVLPALGAGRAGFLRYGNLYLKDLGFTPLLENGKRLCDGICEGGLRRS